MRAAVRAGDVGHVAHDVDAREAGDAEVGLDVDASASPLRHPRGAGQRRRLDAAAPDHAASGDRHPVGQRGVPGADLAHRRAEVQPHALAAEHLGDVGVRVLGERAEQGVAEVDEVDARGGDSQVVVLGGHRLVDQVGQRPGRFDAGRPAAHDHEVQRALVDQRRVPVGLLEDGEDARAQPLRVVERVERERVLAAPGVRKKLGCEPAANTIASPLNDWPSVVVTVCDAGSTRLDLGELDVDVRVAVEQLAQREGDVARRQLRGRHLVEQRLELVVVVAVEQRDPHVVVLGQPPRAADAGEAAADDDHVRCRVVRHMRRLRLADARAEALEQVVAHPQRVGHRRQRRVDRADAREEAGVDDVEVVDLVRAAVGVEHRRRRVEAEAAGARPGGRSPPPGCRS